MVIVYYYISGSGSGLISILQPLLLLPTSSYYFCVSPPRQYVNYLTTTVYFRKYLIVLLIKFRSITYLALRPLGAGVICAWISSSSSGSIAASSSPSLIFCRLFSRARHLRSAPSVTASARALHFCLSAATTASFCKCSRVVNSPIPRSAPPVSSNLLPFNSPNSSSSRLGNDVNACPRCFLLFATVPRNLSV